MLIHFSTVTLVMLKTLWHFFLMVSRFLPIEIHGNGTKCYRFCKRHVVFLLWYGKKVEIWHLTFFLFYVKYISIFVRIDLCTISDIYDPPTMNPIDFGDSQHLLICSDCKSANQICQIISLGETFNTVICKWSGWICVPWHHHPTCVGCCCNGVGTSNYAVTLDVTSLLCILSLKRQFEATRASGQRPICRDPTGIVFQITSNCRLGPTCKNKFFDVQTF